MKVVIDPVSSAGEVLLRYLLDFESPELLGTVGLEDKLSLVATPLGQSFGVLGEKVST